MTTASEEKEEAGQLPAEDGPGTLRREGRTCASSVAPADSIALDAVTQSARAMFRGSMSVLAALDRAGSLGDAQLPTLRQARAEHHRCAGHYRSPLLRLPRLLWAYVHLLIIKPALNGFEWVTFSPARFIVAAGILAALWFGGLA